MVSQNRAWSEAVMMLISGVLFAMGLVSCQSQEEGAGNMSPTSTPQHTASISNNTAAFPMPTIRPATPSGVLGDKGSQGLTVTTDALLPTVLASATTTRSSTATLTQNKGVNTMAPSSANPIFLQTQGVLHVRVEYHQAQMGVSVLMGGGPFRPLTTVYDWWVDAQNLNRYRRMTTELLEDGPHLIGADGANGGPGWWIVDWARGVTEPERHDGPPPFGLTSLKDFTAIFARDGQLLVKAAQSKAGAVQVVGQTEQPLWENVLSIQKSSAETGQVLTATVRAEAPNVLIESVTVDKQGQLFESGRITNWEWFDSAQFDADFWMNPPADIPLGPGKLKP